MAEKDTIFESKIKYTGVFSFKDFYKFCYDWLVDETGLDVEESKYIEKLTGETKTIEIEWNGSRKLTDYFKFNMKITFRITGLKNVQINQNGKKIDTNSGSVEIKAKGVLVRDYEGKFEKDALRKFARGIYEKWVIASRIEEYEGKIFGNCDDFLTQAKAYLDLEGKR